MKKKYVLSLVVQKKLYLCVMKITTQKKNDVTITTKFMNLAEYRQSLTWPKELMENKELIEQLTKHFTNEFIKEHGVDGIKSVKSYEYEMSDDDDFFKDL